ncbi:MAG TPA: MGMT family protein [Gammaproteobacteria bacterium]|nr:MGMT family protein [Gammaproteobacteria bacterium]
MPPNRPLSIADDGDAPPPASVYARIYEIVRQIPAGRVATYGQVAAIEGHCTARMVGYAMAALGRDDVPWQRVINGQGRISERSGGGGTARQRLKLMEEGVRFDSRGRIDFERFGWDGPDFGWIRDQNMFAAAPPWCR